MNHWKDKTQLPFIDYVIPGIAVQANLQDREHEGGDGGSLVSFTYQDDERQDHGRQHLQR